MTIRQALAILAGRLVIDAMIHATPTAMQSIVAAPGRGTACARVTGSKSKKQPLI
ncbi:hypothetical protein [Noviherbaspirillum galbum]|uniref:Uncharacterized protein n=1 Tax=Noviherbaspirillum galbum TaxID=2709383 RepID=A0A6B3SZM5_9BURK|nr:hypothetical protein [Noviherbaspirillum galbum]NEX64269.1 hypothetical protein [Noviherbaspirillum galbum]